MTRTRASGVILLALLLLMPAWQATAAAATLTLGLLQRADDERHAPARTTLAYPGHPGGSLQAAVALAVDDSRFELDAAQLRVLLDVRAARSADEAQALLQQLARAGAAGVVLDLPAGWVAALPPAAALPLINAGDGAEALRLGCRPALFHTLPGERMRADALAQALLARRWARVLLLHGPGADDALRLAQAQAALKRHGLKTVATRPFKLSADPRERDLAHPLLLTGPAAGGDYDVVWVVDSDGEFARTLPYRTALPRPVVGDAGLSAVAWGAHFERYGSPQLARRFERAAKRPMTGHDWAAWVAAKAVLQAALQIATQAPVQPTRGQPAVPGAAQVLQALQRADFTIDGFKGVRLGFRPWDRQLRQPVLLSDGVAVIGSAPVDGVLHPSNVLDTLGADAAESACKPVAPGGNGPAGGG